MDKSSATRPWNAGSLLIVGLGSGILAGLVEGAGLLFFQRLNWARWGPMIHVSGEIVWISPIVCVTLFLSLALICCVVARLAPRLPAVRVLVFLLTFFSVYDWLTLTGRLYHRACFLLALGVAVAFARWCGKRENTFLQFWKRTTPWIVAVWIVAFGGIQGGKWLQERNAVAHLPAAAAGAPNVLVIVEDTLRADHLSAYGYTRPTSPNFDRMARQGVLFENAVSTTAWSLPSHVSLLDRPLPVRARHRECAAGAVVGMGPHRALADSQRSEKCSSNGVIERVPSPPIGPTSPPVSALAGASSISKIIFTRPPTCSFARSTDGSLRAFYLNRTDKSKVKRALRFLGMYSMLDKDSEGSGNYGGAQGVRKRADVVNQEVLRWIDHGQNDGGETHPFFAFLNYFDVHYPYGGPPTYPKPEWDRGGRIDEYDASVKYADDALGRLLQALDQRGLTKNTLVIVTSDHGESLGQHGLTYHGQALYRELIHVPLVMWYPGQVPAAKVQTPVTNAAIPATILDILGARAQPNVFPCSSLSALWQSGGGTDWPDPLSELARNDIADKEDKAAATIIPTATTGAMKSLVTPQWQLITHESMGDQLYDWALDPGESNNLIHSAEGQTTAGGLKSRLENVVRPVK